MALAVQWDEKYCVGDATIDGEHQTLFELANEVFAILNPAFEEERFKSAVKRLFQYVETHFRHEEELMAKIAYRGRAAHSQCHARIVARMQYALRSSKSQTELLDSLKHLMLDWVLRHILEEDRQIADQPAVVG